MMKQISDNNNLRAQSRGVREITQAAIQFNRNRPFLFDPAASPIQDRHYTPSSVEPLGLGAGEEKEIIRVKGIKGRDRVVLYGHPTLLWSFGLGKRVVHYFQWVNCR